MSTEEVLPNPQFSMIIMAWSLQTQKVKAKRPTYDYFASLKEINIYNAISNSPAGVLYNKFKTSLFHRTITLL